MRYSQCLKTLAAAAFLAPIADLALAETQSISFANQSETGLIIQDTGVANRLVAGEILRSLTQEIPAAACHLHHQINVADATDTLDYGVAQVDELLAALTDGDIYWGITTPETRRRTIAEISELRAAWTPVLVSSRKLLAAPDDLEAMRFVVGMGDVLMDRTDRFLATLDGQYAGSAEILQRDVMFIQISGRMAALNQQMALQACQLSAAGFDTEIAAALEETATRYDNSLNALRFGLDAMGILPPQTAGIADKLTEIADDWSLNEPDLLRIAAGTETNKEEQDYLYYNLIDERVLVLDLLYLYQDHSKIH